MTTIKLQLKGMTDLVTYFQKMIWAAKYLPEDSTEITQNIKDDESLTFTLAGEDETPDGTVLIYDPNNKESWDLIVKEMGISQGKTVIAGWYDTESALDGNCVTITPKKCPFIDKRTLSLPFYEMVFVEDLWSPLQDITENKLGRELKVSLRMIMTPAYWGECLRE